MDAIHNICHCSGEGYSWSMVIAALATLVLTSFSLGWLLEQLYPSEGRAIAGV